MGKNKFLLVFISLVLMLGISGFVMAVDGVNASLTEVQEEGSVVTPISGVYYLNNGTYLFNFTLENLNSTYNVTGINISLDTAFSWGGGNWSGVAGIQFINISNNLLRWNRTANPFVLNTTSNSSWFAFNATIDLSSASDGNYNFTVKGEYDGSKSASSFNVDNNVTVDNTAPTSFTAVTNSTTTINITFNENILGSSFEAADFYIVIDGTNYTASSATQNNGQVNTITVSTFAPNATPTVYLNGSSSLRNITDYAGNTLLSYNVVASDKVRPSLLTTGLIYNYSTRNLTLVFDEPVSSNVYLEGILLIDNVTSTNFLTLNSGNETTVSVTPSENSSTITLSAAHRDLILGWKPVTIGLNISLLATTFNDSNGNPVNVVNNQTINTYVLDTIDPSLIGASYTHSSRNLTLTFSETMDVSTVNVSNIYIGNQSNQSNISLSRLISLNGATVDRSTNSSSFVVTLTEALAANLSEWRVTTLYIWQNGYNITATDLTGRNMTPISNQSALPYLNSSTYTRDTTPPVLSAAIVLSDPSPTKAGTIMFNVTFNEYMDRGTTINVTLHPNATSNTYVVTGSWFNYTLWNGTFTINNSWYNDVGDGTTIINVSGARDVAYNTMTANNTNTFVIDTTSPTLTMVWYNDTNYDYNVSTGEQLGNDFLILKFSENVTVVTANDTTAIYIANGSTTSGAFEGNSSASQGGIFVRLSDYKKVKVAINNTMKIWVRGIYNGTGKVQGIIVKNGTTAITDEAGNPLVNTTGVKDIYDNVLTYTADANGVIEWKGFSIPYEINTSITSDALTSYTSQIYTHNGTQWVSTSVSSLIPYRGYLIKLTGVGVNNSVDIPIATTLFGGANPDNTWTTSIKIDDGAHSLIGVDGYLDNEDTDVTDNADWLGSFPATSTVSYYIDPADTSRSIDPTATTAGAIKPYMAFWIWTATNQNVPYDFAGYGRW
jgi:hypothetical protein